VRVLHVATYEKSAAGKLEQLRAEQKAVQRLGLPWDILVWSKDEPVEPFMRQLPHDCGGLKRRVLFAHEIENIGRDYDAVLIRYDSNNPFLIRAVRSLRLWISEHHAIEYLEQGIGQGLKARCRAAAEKVIGQQLLSKCDGVVAVTSEILRYQQSRTSKPVPGNVMPNGIDTESVRMAGDERGGVPKLFFIATNFLPWHGLEKILAALECYGDPVELHLIGNVGPELMRKIDGHSKRQRIVVHGFVDSRLIPELLTTCDAALSAFNSRVTGLTQASRLKVRHMLAMGVPVIGGEADASFPSGFRFYKEAPSPDMRGIVQYAVSCRSASRDQVRKAAAPYIDKAAIVLQQYHWMRALYEQRRHREHAGNA
jgi:hypothetical protein